MPLRSSQLRRRRHDVVHVLATATTAGIAQARIVASLAAGLDPRRYRVEAWFLDRPGPLTSMLEDAGVPARVLRFTGVRDTRGTLRFARALIATHPSIIHFHVGGRARIWLAAALPTTKVIVHVGAAIQEDGHALNRRTAVPRSADAVICTSHAVARLLSPHATVAWPGVELPPGPPTPVEATTPTIGTAARLEPVKHISALVEDGVTGFLVPPRDARELADRIDRLLRSSELRMRMGAAARARASAMFSREQMVETIEGVYRQLLD